MAKQTEAMLKKAQNALLKKNYGLAIYTYIQALTIDMNNVDIRQALRMAQTKNAQENGTKGFKAMIAMLKANFHKALKKTDAAIIDCENGLTANPGNLKLLTMLADLCADSEYLESAIWQRQFIADKLSPEDTGNLWALEELYKEAGRAQEAIGCLERIRELDPQEDIDTEIREVSALLSSRIFEQAARDGSRSVLNNAEESEKLELDAGKLRNDEQRRAAIKYRLDNDLKERPKDYAIWLTIGDIAANFDEFAVGYVEAMKYFNNAQELNPANSAIKDRIGDLEMKKNRLEIQQLTQKAKSGDEEAKTQLAQLRKKDLQFQLEDYERRVKDQPMKAEFHNKLGQVYLQLKRYDDAIAELQQASKDPRFKISALTNIGRCMLAQNNPKMAIKQFERAREGVEIFDKYREAMYFEAAAYQALGDAESLRKAQELFTKLYEVDINFRDVKVRVKELQEALSA